MASEMTVHNFKFNLDKSHIPLLVGKGGKNLFIKVIKASIDEFKTLKEPTHQEKIDMVKNGDIMIKNLRIEIKHNDDVAEPFTYATWSDVKVLEQANVLLIHIIQKKITECAESVKKYVETKDMHKSKKPEERKYKQVFNFRMNLGEDVQIGQFIGNGGETINEFKKKIVKEIDVEKVYINIDDFDNDTYMYRVIGDVISAEDDLMFKISFLGGKREDILKVEKMLISFVNENHDDDESDSDSDSDNDSDNDSDSDDDDSDSDNDSDNDSDKDSELFAAEKQEKIRLKLIGTDDDNDDIETNIALADLRSDQEQLERVKRRQNL